MAKQEQDPDIDRWKKLDVWRLADDLARSVYAATREFPSEELYGLTSQLRRSALSVPTNIVEGYSRGSDKELARFLDVALGSLAEVKYPIHFSASIGYLRPQTQEQLESESRLLGKKLWSFTTKVKQPLKK